MNVGLRLFTFRAESIDVAWNLSWDGLRQDGLDAENQDVLKNIYV